RMESRWRCHAVNEVYVRRFLDLAGGHGIQVYWLQPPVSPGIQANVELAGDDAAYQAFVRSIQRDYHCVTVVDGRHSGYDNSAFFDPPHLARDGAAAVSAGIGEIV